MVKVLIDNGADVNDKDKVSSDSLLVYEWVCLVKVCTGWNEFSNEGMFLWPFQNREGADR